MTDLRAALSSSYGDQPRQRFDLFVPDRPVADALLVCVHGGWWSSNPPFGKAQSHEDLRPFCCHLAENGLACAAVSLRNLKEQFARNGSDLVADVVNGTKRAIEEANLLGLPRAGVILLGSGSGSLPALVAAHRLVHDGTETVRGVICAGVTPSLDPADGMSAALRTVADQFAGDERGRLSPLQLLPDGFPLCLLLHGDSDSEVPPKLAARFGEHLSRAGEALAPVLIPGGHHQLVETVHDRPARAAIAAIGDFVRAQGRLGSEPCLFAGKDA